MVEDEPDDRIDDETHVEDGDGEGDVIEDGDGEGDVIEDGDGNGDADEAETREFEDETEDGDEDEGFDEEEFEVERTTTRGEAAALLHDLADGVASGSVAFDEGALVADIPETVDLEVEYEREDDESEIEVELEWPTEGDVDGEDSAERGTDDGENGDGGAETEDSSSGAEDSEGDVEDSEIEVEDPEEGVESDDETSEEDDETTEDDETVDATESEVVGLVEPSEAARSRAQFEVYRDRADKWRWRLVHHNGNIIADGGGGYARKANARKGLESVKRNAPGALVVENE